MSSPSQRKRARPPTDRIEGISSPESPFRTERQYLLIPMTTFAAEFLCQDSRLLFARRFSYVKKTPFCSFPSTEPRCRVGSGASDSKWKPGWSAVQLIVAPVLRNDPLKPCTLL